MLIKFFLIQSTCFTIYRHHKCFVIHRLDILLEMLSDKLSDFLNTPLSLEEVSRIDRSLKNSVQLLDISHTMLLRQTQELTLESLFWQKHFIRCKRVVQRQCRAISDTLADAVLVQISFCIRY